MFKQNKVKIIISSFLTLSPILFGIIFWDKLPSSMAIHFGTNGTADGFGSKALSVFLLPIILFVLNLVCFFATLLDKSQKNQTKKGLSIIFWIMPIISFFVNGVMYSTALGNTLSIFVLMPILFGILFIFIGNYMPKVKQNRTLGIKIGFTLANEENWNKTHRFTGKLWFAVGIVVLFSAILPKKIMLYILPILLLVAIILPFVYSYSIYKKHKKQGIEYDYKKLKSSTVAKIITAICVPLILILIAVIMFTGNIKMQYDKKSFSIKASYFPDLEIKYDDIDKVEYVAKDKVGERVMGFSSSRLLMGTFQNKELGEYTRYSYVGEKTSVKVIVDDKIIIINGKDKKETIKIYIDILSAIQSSLD